MTRIDDGRQLASFLRSKRFQCQGRFSSKEQHDTVGWEETVLRRQFGSVPVVNFNYKNNRTKTFAPQSNSWSREALINEQPSPSRNCELRIFPVASRALAKLLKPNVLRTISTFAAIFSFRRYSFSLALTRVQPLCDSS